MQLTTRPLSSFNSGRKSQRNNLRRHPARFCGGFVIDARGHEVAITEQMVQQACRQLDSLSVGH